MKVEKKNKAAITICQRQPRIIAACCVQGGRNTSILFLSKFFFKSCFLTLGKVIISDTTLINQYIFVYYEFYLDDTSRVCLFTN